MKIALQISELTLTVHGKERTFSESELVAILEEYFPKEYTKQVSKVQGPKEGEWFEVNPLDINQELFRNRKENLEHETKRRIILEAFEELKNKPEEYAKVFYTLIPEKNGQVRTVRQLKKIASIYGDHMANWVEQALEWAQRIYNGESWEDICDKPDTVKWHRVVAWKNKCAKIIGGAKQYRDNSPPSNIDGADFREGFNIYTAVPLVVGYKK